MSKRRKGFSLLELLAVVTILGIIAAMVLPRVAISKTDAQNRAHAQNKAEINAAVERFYLDTGGWPANDLSDMLPTSTPPVYDYLPDGIPVNPLTGAADYTLNGTTHRCN
jgi:prepilin-type N-terminal cleavage/methylation domain-containing protein